MKSIYFLIWCSVLSFSTIYSQIVNEGVFKISPATTVTFQADYTNKNAAQHVSDGELYVQNNFVNNGQTSATSGATFFNNDSLNVQSISGTSTETQFYNLTIDNLSVVYQNMDVLVDNIFLINTGNSYTVLPAKKLTVTSVISNLAGNSGLILQSDSSGTASLIHHSDNVSATVERYISGAAEDWHFLSSPVENQTIANSNWVPSGTYGNGTGYDLYVWEESSSCWVYQLNTTGTPNWSTAHPQTNFIPGRGYLYSAQQLNPTSNFQGILNNGTVSYSTTANSAVDVNLTGFNLIGNPYASAIDWKATTGWTRSNLVDSGGGYDMWIWNATANNYGVFNSNGTIGTNGVTQYIGAMQGFFVRAASNANIAMTNDVRLHTGASYWLKTGQTKNSVNNPIKLKVKIASESNAGFDEVLFHFGHSNNTAGAAKLFSAFKNAPSVYTNMEAEKLSVKYLTDTIQNPSVPVCFQPGENGRFTLSFDAENGNFKYLFLEDKIQKTLHNLLENPQYIFNSSVNDASERFVLHFTSKNSVLEDNTLEAPIYYDGASIVIDLRLVDDVADVTVFDVLGKQLIHKNLEGQSIHRLSISSKNQLYLVTLKTKDKSLRKKIIVY